MKKAIVITDSHGCINAIYIQERLSRSDEKQITEAADKFDRTALFMDCTLTSSADVIIADIEDMFT